MMIFRPLTIGLGLLALWQVVVWVSGAPPYILPAPGEVMRAVLARADTLALHAGVTLAEIALGLVFGTLLGMAAAISLAAAPRLRLWLLSVLVISQALPVFALAPILVLWLGYGLASKVAMAALIIFFPVTAAFYDGLRRTDPLWLDVARSHGL
ncbi:MAG: ABC transporter permease subunit, partial [Pseudomonadota bacterium]|nr:ABC transporter permease subunit [Pseudomonadota bacterium]